jgi:hypothetical protein
MNNKIRCDWTATLTGGEDRSLTAMRRRVSASRRTTNQETPKGINDHGTQGELPFRRPDTPERGGRPIHG